MHRPVIVGGLVLTVALGWPAALRADVVHLVNGGQMQVEAWRDAGDAIEFLSRGGIVRIAKSEIRKIEGRPTRGDLRMYSTGETVAATGGGAGAPVDQAAATQRMSQLLKDGEALFEQGALTNPEKATAFRRLGEQWREVEVPDTLRSAHARGQQAFQVAFEAFQAESQIPADPSQGVPARLARARAELSGAQEEVKKAEEEEAKKQPG